MISARGSTAIPIHGWVCDSVPQVLLFSWLFARFPLPPDSSLLLCLCFPPVQPHFTHSASPLCVTLEVSKAEGLTGPCTTVLANGLGRGQFLPLPDFRQLPLEHVRVPGVAGHVSMAHIRATYVRGTPQNGLWAYKHFEALNKWAGEWAGCLIESVHCHLGGRKMGYSGCGLFYNKGQWHTCMYFTDYVNLYFGY